MIEKIHAFKRLDSDVELKVRQIAHLKLDASSLEAVKKLKGKCNRFILLKIFSNLK